MYVDIFVAGVGKWYEFECTETEKVKDIMEQIYCTVVSMESLSDNNMEQENSEILIKVEELYLACIDSKKVLDPNFCLKQCPVKNGNKLILF